MKYLIFDAGNILYRTFYVHKTEDDITIAGMAAQTALITINKYFKQHKPCKVVMAFDRHSWRKDYTAGDECVSKKGYKANRRQNMTKKEEKRYELFIQHVEEFEHMIDKYTSIIAVADDGLEADDVIAGFVQTISVSEPNSEVIIISADKDLIQLLRHDNTRLVDPATGNDRTLEDWDGDANLFMFEKCLRGDSGDNVQSAYPRIFRKRILKAYGDPYERESVMQHEWVLPLTQKKVKVKDLYKENSLLMDLEEQPKDIQEKMIKTVVHGLRNPGRFDYFHFLKYLGKYDLRRISENVETIVPLLSS